MVLRHGQENVLKHSRRNHLNDISGVEDHRQLLKTPEKQVHDRQPRHRQPSRRLFLQEIPRLHQNLVRKTRPLSRGA